jgi:sugar O-acyltransferase (sialic acid O-acetyltransferase NeuD family)
MQIMSPASRLPIVVFGCGGHDRVVADALKVAGAPLAGFWTNGHLLLLSTISRCLVIAAASKSRNFRKYTILIAISETRLRRRLSLLVLDRGGNLAEAVHPSAVIAPNVSIGQGTAIMAGVVINTSSRIGRFAIINTGATVDHDNLIKDGVHISPGCHLAGNVISREDAFIVITPRCQIGTRAAIGAGAAVISDIAPDVLGSRMSCGYQEVSHLIPTLIILLAY